MTRVLVVIPTHNRAEFIAESVESALAQTYGDREILDVDDGSTDDTGDRLEPYLDRIAYLPQEQRGRSAARNRALERDAELVAFLDSDDAWLPDKLERQVEALDADPSLGLVHGHVELIDDRGSTLAADTARLRELYSAANSTEATYARFALECRCLTSTVVVRRAVLAEAGGYDTAFEHLEDLDLYLRILQRSRIGFLDGAPLTRYRWHAGQSENLTLARAQIAVAQKHLALLAERPELPGARRARRNFATNVGRGAHMLLEPRLVRRATRDAVAAEPSALLVTGVLRRFVLSFVPQRLLARARARRTR